MAKDFTKTMSFDAFKEMHQGTQLTDIFHEFVVASNNLEKCAITLNNSANELIKLFLSQNDYVLFTYEHLLSSDEYKPSEIVKFIQKANIWNIIKVSGKNEVIITFTSEGKMFTTTPISFHEIKEFLNIN